MKHVLVVECYEEGPDPDVLGKLLNYRCMTQAYFKFEKSTQTWHKVPRLLTQVHEEAGEDFCL